MKHKFDLSGGELCLDFANTMDNRRAPEKIADNLKSYDHLLAFVAQSGVLAPADETHLARLAASQPAEAARVLRQAVELREATYRIGAAVAARRAPHHADLARLNRELQAALPHMKLQASAGGFRWTWQDDDALNAPLWRIAKSAADLLSSSDLGNIRECAEESCGWLFVDRSRNRARRWCDMKTCGNRAKARRHYRLLARGRRKSSLRARS
ncbi:MAG: ABATE domain-containing protein [Acidobacteriales bacterium]|nr:ABATE domain-containing protein [Terriglobales bacterium]